MVALGAPLSRHPAIPPSRLPRARAPARPRAPGFTLIEVLVGLVLLAIVSAILFQLVISSQRVSQAQMERGNLQANARAGVLILPGELRELGYSTHPGGSSQTTDIRDMGPDFIRIRAQRGFGVSCGASPGPNDRIFVRNGPVGDGRLWRGLRQPAAGDTVFVFIEYDPTLSTDDRWKRSRVTAVNASTCTDGSAAIQLTISPTLTGSQSIGSLDNLRPGAPVLWFELLQYESYVDATNGQTWLGLRVNGGGLEPVLGPLENGSGLRFRYFGADGNEIPSPDMDDREEVRSIEVQVNGASARPVRSGGGSGTALVTDTVRFSTRVVLRNSLERP